MRAQIWSIDFIVSVVIFAAAVAMILFVWGSASSQAAESLQITELQKKAITAADTLVRIKGVPENWVQGNVTFIGLAEREGVISSQKVAQLLNMGYGDARGGLQLGGDEFYLALKDSNGTFLNATVGSVSMQIEYGNYPNSSKFVVPVERYVLYNGELARLQLIVWRAA